MFLNRVRLPIYFSKPQFPIERNVFKKADGSRKVLSAVISNTYEGKTDLLPKEWHQKLAIALNHDVVNIESDRLLTEVVMDSEYEIDWQEFLDYPIAQAGFKVQVTPFYATNSNCQTCDEITQLELVDDTTADVFAEGTTDEFPFSVLLNDNICCYPFEISISSFNTTYFSSVTVNAAGIVTFTVLPSVPTISNVLLATYRVTCPNGAYDEANIYVGISGTSTECVGPGEIDVSLDPTDGTVADMVWDDDNTTRACGWDWVLYASDDIYTVLQSGNTAFRLVNLTGLTPGTDYVFTVQGDCCAGDLSTISMVEFTPVTVPENLCGNFLVTYIPIGADYFANISYMDCNGAVQNFTTVSVYQAEICMLINDGSTVPVFFAADRPEVTIEYLGLCS